MFWFLNIRFGPEYFLKMNISVNISDLCPCSYCYKCDLRPLYFAQKCHQNAGDAVSETQNSNILRGAYPPGPPANLSSLFNNVTYFALPPSPPQKNKILAAPLGMTIKRIFYE